MSSPLASPVRRRGAMALADITGYTAFLQGVADSHRDLIVDAEEPPPAYAVLSHLLDTMLTALEPTFRLAKFEGDAVFVVADDADLDGDAVRQRLLDCHAAFRRELGVAGVQWTCTCAACARVDELDVKFIVHHGAFVAQTIAGQKEFVGPDVNLVHRLLKNHARDMVGPSAYVLFTAPAVEAMGLDTAGMLPGVETYDDMPNVCVQVLRLGAAA